MKILLWLCFLSALHAQSDPRSLNAVLSSPIQKPEVTEFQLRQYAMKRVPVLQTATDARTWTAEASRIRQHLLDDVIFHGWPREWVTAKPKFEKTAVIETGQGYRITKLRYEIVPGFFGAALLYEPANLTGRAPAILNVNGHVGAPGKAVEYKQKRCINFAKRGILALNLEWLGYGELGAAENHHSYAAHLDLAGANGIGLFYLAMRKGLDYLYDHPNTDRARIGVTGLSGGGWQTITLSALDERVKVAVPVAGFSTLTTAIEHPEYVGNDIEQNATDFRAGQDYAHLTAMMAPRPTLLIYNAEDDCCFRAPLVKEGVYENSQPFFRLFGKPEALAWHENSDPGTHNYQLDNRLQAYRFFAAHFKLPEVTGEIPSDAELKTPLELEVGLPKDNLTILGLAKKLAAAPEARDAESGPISERRARLRTIVRYAPVTVRQAWALASTKSKGIETRSYLFELSNGLCATGVWVKAIAAPDNAPLTIVLNDRGRKAAAAEVSESVNRGEQVLAADLLFTGDNSLADRLVPEYTQLLGAIGDRPVGLEAAQLHAIGGWMRARSAAKRTQLSATGVRSQTVSLIAAALQPDAFQNIEVKEAMRSFGWLLQQPASYAAAPDLFCRDLYKYFDVPGLAALGSPATTTLSYLP